MPDLGKWFDAGQKKTKTRKNYWKGFGAALKRGKKYNRGLKFTRGKF